MDVTMNPGRAAVAALSAALFVGLAAVDTSASERALPAELVEQESSTIHDPPTFYRDVLPILRHNCQSCHREAAGGEDGGLGTGFHAAELAAPMALETYEQVRPWAPIMASAVEERRMPPWGADIQHRGTFRGERYLDAGEIAVLVAWAEMGAPAGDIAEAPELPPLPEISATGWAIGEPDLVVRVPEPYRLDDEVVDLYVNLHIPLSEEEHPEPRWIRGSQLAPGSAAVHHINSPYLGTVAPGRGPNEWPEGFGILLPAGEELVLDMHYHKFDTSPGSGVYDQSGGAFSFYEEGVVITHMIETFTAFPGGQNFVIPAGDPNFAHTASRTFDEDIYLLSTAPHMHLRGKASKLEVEYPDGSFETLLWIPNYDFAWQHKYDWKEPLLLPAGSTLHMTMWWDNSADNPHNPDHTRDVPYGLASIDEMMTARIFWARAEPIHHVVGDPIPEELYRAVSPSERSRDREILHLVVDENR
jgi:hypothetical protein